MIFCLLFYMIIYTKLPLRTPHGILARTYNPVCIFPSLCSILLVLRIFQVAFDKHAKEQEEATQTYKPLVLYTVINQSTYKARKSNATTAFF